MVHGLRQVQLADRREHAERVARQEDDVLGVWPDAWYLGVGDVLDRVRGTSVLCNKIHVAMSLLITIIFASTVCDLWCGCILFLVMLIFTCDRFIGVIDLAGVLVEDNVLQHCTQNISVKCKPPKDYDAHCSGLKEQSYRGEG